MRVWLLPSAALLAFAQLSMGACTDPEIHPIPFSCAANHECPSGYRCDSDFCIPLNAPDLPGLLDRSSSDFSPTLQQDPERSGMLACWVKQESQNSADATVMGSFLRFDGATMPNVELAHFDARNARFLASCAPVPHSGGRVIVALWIQSGGQSELRLTLWSPNSADLYHGTSSTYYSEIFGVQVQYQLVALTAAVVGNEVWVPFQDALPSGIQTRGTDVRLGRLRIGTPQLDSGVPTREILPDVPINADDVRLEYYSSNTDTGAWFAATENFYFRLGFLSTDLSHFQPFVFPLTPNQYIAVPVVTVEDSAAVLWGDPLERAAVGRSYRVAWALRDRHPVVFGPRLPFARSDTSRPGAFRLGDYLYLVGAPVGAPLPGRPIDGGLSDASVQMSPGTGSSHSAVLTLYRVRWGADDVAPVETVATFPRQLGDVPVSSAAACLFPDRTAFGLAWVATYPPTVSGHGAEHVLFLAKFPFSPPP